LHQWLTGDVRAALLVLFGAVGLVLLIACANFAGLQVARAVARRQEMVIRAALGAGRNRLIRQALTESALLSLLGGAAGLLLAKGGTSLLLSLKPAALDRFNGIQMNAAVLLFVLSVSMVTGIMFGLAPGWSAAGAQVAESLRASGRSTTTGPSGHRLRRVLVTTELTLALVLLIGAGLLVKGFSRLRAVNPGFNPSRVLTMDLQLPATRYARIPQQTQFRRELLTRLNSLPGVQAAMISDIPLGGDFVDHNFVIEGRPPVPTGSEPELQTLSVMGDYFRVMQIPLRAGRDFTLTDREGQPLVEMVKEFFPHENPLGARIDWARTQGPHRWMTIVGIVANVKYSGLNQPSDPAVYAPFSQSDEAWRRWMTLALRTPSSPSWLAAEAKKQVWSVDGHLPVNDVQMMDDLLAESIAQPHFLWRKSARSRDWHSDGPRFAKSAVLRMVMGEGARLAFFGIAMGIAGALALTRVMKSLLFEVRPSDPVTFAVVASLLAIVSLAACYIPARRAMRVDPMVALRYE
jgi:putative ABC transport system permease protein